MIIVTGGAGFIGSNIVAQLNALGETDILVVDDLTDGTKFKNLVGLKIRDYLDKDVFLSQAENKNTIKKKFAENNKVFRKEIPENNWGIFILRVQEFLLE